MGCDIHLAVEVRDGSGWQRAEPFEPNPYARFVDEPAEVRQRWYHDRNYRLFAMLADVRNGRGTAGVDTGDRLIPIDEPRGLPDDVSKEVYEDSAKWGVDGHSHSHFTLAEVARRGLVGNRERQPGLGGSSPGRLGPIQGRGRLAGMDHQGSRRGLLQRFDLRRRWWSERCRQASRRHGHAGGYSSVQPFPGPHPRGNR